MLPAPHFHIVFTPPAEVGAIAYQNKAAVYGLLFKTAARTFATIAASGDIVGARTAGEQAIMAAVCVARGQTGYGSRC